MRQTLRNVIFVLALCMAPVALQAQIRIDGSFFDWKPQYQLDVAPQQVENTFNQGDPDCPDPAHPNYFSDLDISDVYATDDADYVYIRIKMNPNANIANIPTDTSYHGGAAIAAYISVDPGAHDTTGLTWGWWGSGYDYQIQASPSDTFALAHTYFQQLIYEHKQTGNGYDFAFADTMIGAQVIWNAANNDVEMAIPKSILFHPHFINNFTQPDSIAIMIYAGENLSPWRADYASNAGVKGLMMKVKKPGSITIDGTFFDWKAQNQVDVAPQAEEKTFANGDPDCPNPASPNYFADLDIQDVYLADDADFVYCRIKMNPVANINNIATDTSYHGGAAIAAYISIDPGSHDTTGLTWGWWGSGYDYFIQSYPADTVAPLYTGYQQYIYEHKQTGNGYDFAFADTLRGCWVQWNASSNDCEMAIPKALLFNPHYISGYTQSDSIAVMIYAGENLSPWRADYASNSGVKGYMFKVGSYTAIKDQRFSSFVSDFKLGQNYPNPFNPSTSISYFVPRASNVKLTVFNAIGQKVTELVNRMQNPGAYTVSFNAKDYSSGIYYYTLEAGNTSLTKKMVLVK